MVKKEVSQKVFQCIQFKSDSVVHNPSVHNWSFSGGKLKGVRGQNVSWELLQTKNTP